MLRGKVRNISRSPVFNVHIYIGITKYIILMLDSDIDRVPEMLNLNYDF